MFSAHARWLLLIGVSSAAFIACGGDDPAPGGTGGSSTGGSSGGSQVGGSAGSGGSSAGSATAGSSSGGMSAGTGGSAGSGSSGGGAGGAGGSGGAGGAGGGGAGGGGGSGGAGGKTATATIMGINGQNVVGTATFTQGAVTTKLVLTLTACPDGGHSSHLHLNNDCGNEGEAAGLHWVGKGEMFGDYTCAGGKVTHMKEKPITDWTVGDGADTDVTKHAFMVHANTDEAGSGGKIGCGEFPP